MKTKHTPGKWHIKETYSKEYGNHIDYSVHAEEQELHTKPEDKTSPLWKFKPFIAEIHFGRTNEEREANAKLIAHAPELLQMVRDLQNCIKLLTTDEVTQSERDLGANWIMEAHELLHNINPDYYKNANT